MNNNLQEIKLRYVVLAAWKLLLAIKSSDLLAEYSILWQSLCVFNTEHHEWFCWCQWYYLNVQSCMCVKDQGRTASNEELHCKVAEEN